MEEAYHEWTPEELLSELAGTRLLGRTGTAATAPVPEFLRSLADPEDTSWEDQLAEFAVSDRAELARAWWAALDKPGVPQTVSIRQQNAGEWRQERITLIDLRHQPEVGVVLVAIHDMGPCEPPDAETAPRIRTVATDRAWFHRPTWILQELDPVGIVIHTQGDVEEVFGRPAAELEGNTVLNYLHPDDHPACVEMWATLLQEPGGTRTILQRVIRPDGSHVWIESTVINRLAPGGEGVVLAVSHDVTERRTIERDLRNKALSDALTGLPNRAALTEMLAEMLSGGPATVAFLDLDGFKEVNDSLGHHVGDEVLAAIALRLRSHLPPSACVGRWGGDEFVVIAPDDSESDLRRAVDAAFADPITVRAGQWHPRASWGAVVGQPGDDPEQLVRSADTAMYEAKERR